MSAAKQEQSKRFEFTVRFLETVNATDEGRALHRCRDARAYFSDEAFRAQAGRFKAVAFSVYDGWQGTDDFLGTYPAVSLKGCRGHSPNSKARFSGHSQHIFERQ